MEKTSYAEDIVFMAIQNAENKTITQAELSNITGYSKRDIRHIVQSLREHYPICSGDYGYKLASSKAEVLTTIYRLNADIKTMQETVDKLVAFLERGILE